MLSIVGKSGSGKTHLILRLIEEIKKRGYTIAIVKHHAHGDFEIDKEGKDTWKFYNGGADAVMISSPVKQALIRRTDGEESVRNLYERYLRDYDIVITEGFNREGLPRIVIADSEEDLNHFSHGEIIAVVSRNEISGFRTLSPDDVGEIADIIIGFEKENG